MSAYVGNTIIACGLFIDFSADPLPFKEVSYGSIYKELSIGIKNVKVLPAPLYA